MDDARRPDAGAPERHAWSRDCACGSGAEGWDCCAAWELPGSARSEALDAVAATLGDGWSGARLRAAVEAAPCCVDVAPLLGVLPGVSPHDAARAVRRAWLLAGRAPDLLHLVAASRDSADAADLAAERRCARYAAWARLLTAAPDPVLHALYGDLPDLVTTELQSWIAATDEAMYRAPALADRLLAGLSAVRARLPELPDARALDVAEVFFLELTGAREEAARRHAALDAAAPGDPQPAVERAAALLFPCGAGVTADVPGAIALLQAALSEADAEQRETWDLDGRIARLQRGEAWEADA